MKLTLDYTRIRLAALPDRIVEQFVEKYQYVKKADGTDLNADDVRMIEKTMETAIPGKGDLATQWALERMHHTGLLFPDSLEALVFQASWYFSRYKEPMFRAAVQEFNEENGQDLNPKNIMDFVFDMDYILEEYYVLEQASRVNTLPEELPEGAELFYDDGSYQIVKVTEVEAVCELGQGSKWCTREESSAQGYLMDSPLYVLYRNHEKIAQLHLGYPGSSAITIELKNIKNRSWTPDAGARRALIGSGLIVPILKRLERVEGAESLSLRFIGTEDDPEMRALCARTPKLALIYAQNVIRGRFPEGEKAIATQPTMAIAYARNLIRGRFQTAESRLIDLGYHNEYASMLSGVNPQGYHEFVKDYPELFPNEFEES